MSMFSNNELAILVGSCSYDTGFDVEYLQNLIYEQIRDGMEEKQATKYICELAYEGDL